MTAGAVPDLVEIRRRLDIVDQQLVALLAQRSALVEEVIVFKRAHSMPVVDRAREDEMLDRIEHTAAEQGLDPRIARQVLRAIIDAFTLLEVEHLGPDAEPVASVTVPGGVRARIDELGLVLHGPHPPHDPLDAVVVHGHTDARRGNCRASPGCSPASEPSVTT